MNDVLASLRDTQRPIYQALAQYGPMTDEQLQDHLAMPANKMCPRRLDLVKLGLVEEVGTAVTSTGRKAKRWHVVEPERVAEAREVAANRKPRRRTVMEATLEEKVQVVQALLKDKQVNAALLNLQGRSAERARARARGARSQRERERRERNAEIKEAERESSALLHFLKALRNLRGSEAVVRSVREFIDLDIERQRYGRSLIPAGQEAELREALSDVIDLAADARDVLDGAFDDNVIEGVAVEISELVLPEDDG